MVVISMNGKRGTLATPISRFRFTAQITLRTLLLCVTIVAGLSFVWLWPNRRVSVVVPLKVSPQLNRLDRKIALKTQMMLLKSDSVIIDALQRIPETSLPQSLRVTANRVNWVYSRLDTSLARDGTKVHLSITSEKGSASELSLLANEIRASYKKLFEARR